MNLLSLLDRLQSLEHEAGCLYRTMAARLRESNAAAAELLARLAEEEKGHEQKVRLVREIVADAGQPPSQAGIDSGITERMDSQLGYIREKQSLFALGMPDLTVSQTIAMALDIEVQLQERHALEAVHVHDVRIRQLMQSLVEADGAHSDLLREWLDKETGPLPL